MTSATRIAFQLMMRLLAVLLAALVVPLAASAAGMSIQPLAAPVKADLSGVEPSGSVALGDAGVGIQAGK